MTKENSRTEQDPPPPVRIIIPGISVDAAVVSVGVEANGSMEVPDETAAGWFEPGARPGAQTGSAVLAGHVDHANAPGVFFDLRRVSVGDAIELLDETGTQHRYTVTERFQVDKDDLPAAELFRRTGPPVLTLITCAGSFDRKNRTYSDNIVIRASPAGLASVRPF